ncbi:MAG: restriction endonuclease [Candidatus Levybacteria bacterium]|nr:restriction endonuclease [Candidatus Levybacteria bacterium]
MINVIKASGEKVPFDEKKVIVSIKRAGIPDDIRDKVLTHVKDKIYDNIPTSEIYRHITEFLSIARPFSRSRYSLKQSIMDLGPTGFPFEDFIAEILKTEGFNTQVRQVLSGRCVSHEIDIIATKDSTKTMIECKFHNKPGIMSNIHVSLYTKSRFDDVKEKHGFSNAWLVTNTKITSDALNYAQCNDMKVVSWSYPEGESLRDLIEKSKLHPITSLESINSSQKQKFLDQGVVLCKTICQNKNLIEQLEISNEQKKKLEEELNFVCNIG